MNRCYLFFPISVLSWLIASPTLAAEAEITNLSEFEIPAKEAKLLTQQPEAPSPTETTPTDVELENNEPNDEADITVDVTGEQDTAPESTPTYVIEKEEIDKQGADSVAEILQGLPGFAVNDAGFGADIHTGTFYRGLSINQSVFLLNGRPIGSNVNTYHGATDLNTLPVESIDRIELSSGTASTLYGSDAFGGVVNIISDMLPH